MEPNFETILFILTLIAAIGSGLIAGVFFAFSVFVMKALAGLKPGEGIRAMQSINVVVINPMFLGVFMGTAGVCVVVVIMSLMLWEGLGSLLSVLGGASYVVGTFGVTIMFNVPRNEVLAKVEPGSAEGAEYWRRYVREWTMWNHVRTAAATAAMVLLTIAICRHNA